MSPGERRMEAKKLLLRLNGMPAPSVPFCPHLFLFFGSKVSESAMPAVSTTVAMTPVVPVTAPETSKEELGQDQQPNGLPERDGFDAEQQRQQVVPKQHHRTSENKYTSGNRYGDENGSLDPESFSSFSSMKHHNLEF